MLQNYEFPAFLTADQRTVVEAVLSAIFGIIVCEAPAGCGKTTVIKACIDALNNVCNDSMTPPATSKMIPIVVSSTNAAVTNAAEGFMDSTNLPLILCSLNAIRKASSKEQDILKLCSLSAYIQRSLDSPTVLFSENEIKILEESLQLELAIEKDFDECAQDAAKNDKKIPACILVEEAAIQNPMDIFDDEEGETCDEKEPSRAEKIRQALNILIDKNPPSMISGTMAMTGRIGAALTGKTEVAFVDEAATVNQANVAAILAEIGTIKKTVFVGMELKTTVLDKNRNGFDEIFSLQDTLKKIAGRKHP
uniref:Uncharacterized protein n=1 Tax=Panagrolaimus sp. PS1159 TaxID=55785 RepID=A0AC35GL76_9BILA